MLLHIMILLESDSVVVAIGRNRGVGLIVMGRL